MNLKSTTFICLLQMWSACGGHFARYESPEEQDSSEFGVDAGAKGTTCECGWANKMAGRIVGGQETKVNEYPLMAAIYHSGAKLVFCGGSILTKRHVLTAAHCTVDHQTSDLKAILGEHDITTESESSSASIQVEKKIEHEEYDHESYINDIAILYLADDIPFSREIGPVCMPTAQVEDSKYVKILGWGRLHNDADAGSSTLMKVNSLVTSIQNCAEMYKKKGINTEAQLCTFRRRKDSCVGDSGGPLLWLDPETNRFAQVGIVSYARKCASLRSPAVNTNVVAYVGWIQEKIAEAGDFQVCKKQG